MMEQDFALALKLQEELNKENTKEGKSRDPSPNKKNKNSLIDPDWELFDPTPNIHELFQAFDSKYFWNSLGSVEVRWSPRMYSCAGICAYKKSVGAIISLSLPLLKLRPRKDLIETLLHEMIHAYLFLTKQFRDRGDHGPEFHKHMNRINADAGTSITVYHNFHNEVEFYKTHWWRCNGPCKNKAPFFGLVKRTCNRPPGQNDFWHETHKQNCGGTFIKIKHPENTLGSKRKNFEFYSSPKKKKLKDNKAEKTKDGNIEKTKDGKTKKTKDGNIEKTKDGKTKKTKDGNIEKTKDGKTKKTKDGKVEKTKDLTHFFPINSPNSHSKIKGTNNSSMVDLTQKTSIPQVTPIKKQTDSSEGESSFSSSSTAVRNVVGFVDFSGLSRTLNTSPNKVGSLSGSIGILSNKSGESSCVPFSGTGNVLGSLKSGPSKSRLLNLNMPSSSGTRPVKESSVSSYIDDCVSLLEIVKDEKLMYTYIFVNCPVCSKHIRADGINEHLDNCVKLNDIMNSTTTIVLSDSDEEVEDQLVCPCCQEIRSNSEEMNKHLNQCMLPDYG